MSKFDVTQWCDFVRGVAAPELEEALRERLASGEESARRTVNVLSRVRAVAEADRELAIPDYAVRIAKAAGSLQRPAAHEAATVPSSSLWRFLPFQISFDSFLQLAPTGTRDLQASHRQLTIRADEYTVDLRLDQDAGQLGTSVVGQVLRRRHETQPMPEVPVLLVAGGQIVERAVTSRFGEFHAEGLPREDLSLYVLVDNLACIALPLAGEAEQA